MLPAYYGGCDRFGWAPASKAAVSDLGNFARRARDCFFPPPLDTPATVLDHVKDVLRGLQREEISEEEAYERLRDPVADWLTKSEKHTLGAAAALVAQGLGERLSSTGRAVRYSNDRQPNAAELLLVPSKPRKTPGQAVLYRDHVKHVVDRVTRFVSSISGHRMSSERRSSPLRSITTWASSTHASKSGSTTARRPASSWQSPDVTKTTAAPAQRGSLPIGRSASDTRQHLPLCSTPWRHGRRLSTATCSYTLSPRTTATADHSALTRSILLR